MRLQFIVTAALVAFGLAKRLNDLDCCWLSRKNLDGQYDIKTLTPSPIRGASSTGVPHWLEQVQHQGDGITDDTAAINLAISDGGRFGPSEYRSSTTTPAVVYLLALLPVIKASSSFSGKWLIDVDQYQSDGAQGWKNLALDLTAVPAAVEITGIRWPTGQATSIQNVQIWMNSEYGAEHQSLFIEDDSNGSITDVLITVHFRNLTVVDAGIGIRQIWNWGWIYQGINLVNCTTAFPMANSGVGKQEIDTVWTESSRSNGSLILENVSLSNVPIAVNGTNGTILQGSGHRYTPSGPSSFQGGFVAPTRPKELLARGVRSAGAKGDGVTVDTSAIQVALHSAAKLGKILFFNQGVFKVSDKIYIPPGARIIGESFPVIMGEGPKFSDKRHPVPVVEVGHPGERGLIECSDMIVSTQSATSGAVLIEWNLKVSPGSGMWDVYVRVGGYAGSELQVAQCPTSAAESPRCEAAFLMMHVTNSAQNVYLENCWIWTADHDLDDPSDTQVSIYTGRGLLIEGGIFGCEYGTSAEHHSLYQYQSLDAHNVVAVYIQTEARSYWQPTNDTSPGPFPPNATMQDPSFSNCTSGVCSALGLRVRGGQTLAIYGAGLYSFFNQYSTSCSEPNNTDKCQGAIFSIEDVGGNLVIYSLNTVGASDMVVRDGHRLASYSDNLATFASTIAYFTL
ncbi:pectin lyase fold/virulence factor [Aspergillus novoparasiticus]|uniref:Pectin lyase fold/virulence factor n=1 Tax=Aspergillus novoparasiticus TaxID=986946 RepID=A0A5N6E7L7_9EURO|nr:pectin lyase fold/virulence factor [Aspergillus novoparasiticus]